MADNRRTMYFDRRLNKWVIRASGFGLCETALVYAGMGLEPRPPSDVLKMAWAEGAAGEDEVLWRFRDARWLEGSSPLPTGIIGPLLDPRDETTYPIMPYVWHEILNDDQFTMEIPVGTKGVIRGHLDGIADIGGEYHVIEAKLLGVDYFKKWVNGGFANMPGYGDQLSLYMAATGFPAYFVVGRKARWAEDDPRRATTPPERCYDIDGVHVTRFDTPPTPLAKLKVRALKLITAAEHREPPTCTTQEFGCPYYHLHDADKKAAKVEVEATEITDEIVRGQVEQAVKAYATATSKAKDESQRAKEAKQELLDALAPLGHGTWAAGDKTITWIETEIAESTRTVKAHKRTQLTIKDV